MRKLAKILNILVFLIPTVPAKITDNMLIDELDFSVGSNSYVPSESLWVLKFEGEDWNSLKLRPGTDDEKEDFEMNAGPLIESYLRRRNSVVKKDGSRLKKTPIGPQNEIQITNIKEELVKIVNKVLLSIHDSKPESNLAPTNDDEPSVTLYFQGPYTAIIVEVGTYRWFFFISPPSSLPAWFYEDRTIDSWAQPNYIEVPEDVKQMFYVRLRRVLMAYFGLSL